MWEKARANLDALFKNSNKIVVERRRNGRWDEFSQHLEFLQSFAAVQSRLIRPGMTAFGQYVESIGHKYYIESAEQLVDGYIFPVSHIAFHVLLNTPHDQAEAVWHSVTFRTDSTRFICVYRKSGGYGAEKAGVSTMCRQGVGRYQVSQLTHEVVESHLKEFLVDVILAKPQQTTRRGDRKPSFPEERAGYAP